MLLLLALNVHAADLDAKLFGKPFAPKTAVGLTEPQSPGKLTIVLSQAKFSCADAIAAKTDEKAEKKTKGGNVLVMQFPMAEPGTTAEQVLAMGGGIAGFAGTATLNKVPPKVGKSGTLTLALSPAPGGPEGSDDYAKGKVSFTLCTKIEERPPLSATKFVSQEFEIVEKSLFPDRKPSRMTVTFPIPQGWTAGLDSLGSPQWLAPDGATTLGLSLFSGSDTFAKDMADQAASQVDAFQTDSTKSESTRAEAIGDGSYVSRWRNNYAGGPWTENSDVYRYEPGWDYAVKCSLRGSELAAKEVFDAGTEACLALTKE